MWKRVDLKTRAKECLNICYWKTVLVALILTIVLGGGGGSSNSNNSDSYNNDSNYSSNSGYSSGGGYGSTTTTFDTTVILVVVVFVLVIVVAGLCIQNFLFNPIAIGAYKFLIQTDVENPSLKYLGHGFKYNYWRGVLTLFLRSLYTFLWTLLLIVPGIIKSYEYRMVPYLLADRPELSTKEIFALSKKLMDGEKWNAFVLDLSFIGWNILSVFTVGLLFIFYVAPYEYLTDAQLYITLKNKEKYM